jgi:hypothetical protein
MIFRADLNRNPTAFTTDIAREAYLINLVDYVQGTSFTVGSQTYYTAHLLGDIVSTTIKVIDSLGFYVNSFGSQPRWSYISLPWRLWLSLTTKQKSYIIGQMYKIEGGTEMTSLFPTEPV